MCTIELQTSIQALFVFLQPLKSEAIWYTIELILKSPVSTLFLMFSHQQTSQLSDHKSRLFLSRVSKCWGKSFHSANDSHPIMMSTFAGASRSCLEDVNCRSLKLLKSLAGLPQWVALRHSFEKSWLPFDNEILGRCLETASHPVPRFSSLPQAAINDFLGITFNCVYMIVGLWLPSKEIDDGLAFHSSLETFKKKESKR